jgi:NTE family protein
VSEQGGGRRVAIACQGGGSHTAFTAGVLKSIVMDEGTKISALSGTSGGAVCALLAWYGLLRRRPQTSVELLDEFWQLTATQTPWERAHNGAVLWAMRAAGELVTPEVSPYSHPFEANGPFLRVLEQVVPFKELKPPLDPQAPRLLISAVDVETGEFRVFRTHPMGHIQADRITSHVVLASSAVPTLFRSVRLCHHLFWDGLFSRNPPLRELPGAGRLPGPDGKLGLPPEEIWIIQINPDHRPGEPTAMADIRNRRNELAANISFQQEVFFISQINSLIHDNHLTDQGLKRFRPIKLRAITMAGDIADNLDYESKLNRDPDFLRLLLAHGEKRGRQFLEILDSPDADNATACASRDIWGRWTEPHYPCLEDPG